MTFGSTNGPTTLHAKTAERRRQESRPADTRLNYEYRNHKRNSRAGYYRGNAPGGAFARKYLSGSAPSGLPDYLDTREYFRDLPKMIRRFGIYRARWPWALAEATWPALSPTTLKTRSGNSTTKPCTAARQTWFKAICLPRSPLHLWISSAGRWSAAMAGDSGNPYRRQPERAVPSGLLLADAEYLRVSGPEDRAIRRVSRILPSSLLPRSRC